MFDEYLIGKKKIKAEDEDFVMEDFSDENIDELSEVNDSFSDDISDDELEMYIDDMDDVSEDEKTELLNEVKRQLEDAQKNVEKILEDETTEAIEDEMEVETDDFDINDFDTEDEADETNEMEVIPDEDTLDIKNSKKVKSYDEETSSFDSLLKEPIDIQDAKEIIDAGEPVYFCEEMSAFYAYPPIGMETIKITDFEKLKEVVEMAEEGIYANKMTEEAQEYISKKISYLMEEEDMPQDQATAVAYEYARDEGYDVPQNSNKKVKSKIRSADQYSIDVKEVEDKVENKDYVPFRESFDTYVKTNKKVSELLGKGYENIKITRYTNIEGNERKFWWEIMAQLPRTPEMEEGTTKSVKPMDNMGTGDRVVIEKNGKEVKAFAEAFERLKEKKPASVGDYEITKTDKGYAVQEKNTEGIDGFVGDFTASEMDKYFEEGWEDFITQEKKVAKVVNEKQKLKAIDTLVKKQEQLIDAFYNDEKIDKNKIKRDIEAIVKKIEDIKSGKIKVKAEPQDTTAPEMPPVDVTNEEQTEENNVSFAEGIELGDGYVVHKDEETNEIYVVDKSGSEVMRTPNVFVDDIEKIKDFYRSVFNIEKPKEETVEPVEDVEIEETPEEPVTIEETLKDIKDKVDELVDIEKTETTSEEGQETDEETDEDNEESKNNEELIKLKQEMDEKKQQVEQVLTSLNENKMIVVSRGDIQKHIIAGENPIFAKKKAKEEKIKRLAKKLWAMDSETIRLLEDTLIDREKKASNKMSSVLTILGD